MKIDVKTMDAAFADLLAADTHAGKVSDAMRRNAPLPPGPTLVSVERYTSRDYHQLEKEHIWKRSWQLKSST